MQTIIITYFTPDGYDYMDVTLGKTEKGEPIIHKVFICELVRDTISELSDYTAGFVTKVV